MRVSVSLVAAVLSLAPTTVLPASSGSITYRDLTPRFMTFYRSATATPHSADERFAVWKQDYGFAAVPPTPDGDKIARKLLDEAWTRYPRALPRIEAGASGLKPSPEQTLQKVESVLRPDKPVQLKLVVYVGAFEGNAFTVGKDGHPTVAIPVEQDAAQRGPVMTHEFVHAVQISMGTNSGGWVRSIGETALAEGLAMRVTQHLYPHLPLTSVVEVSSEPGWLKRAEALRPSIVADVRKLAASSKPDDVLRMTMGTGPSGLDREAYYAGWLAVGYWLHHGMTFADIARIPESEAPARIAEALNAIAYSSVAPATRPRS